MTLEKEIDKYYYSDFKGFKRDEETRSSFIQWSDGSWVPVHDWKFQLSSFDKFGLLAFANHFYELGKKEAEQ